MKYDIVVRNGTVIDKKLGINGSFQIGIKNGKIIKIFPRNEPFVAQQVVDAVGCIVAPGFIDLHVHVYEDKTYLGINSDKVGILQGVTTIVDAGSSGSRTFPYFFANDMAKSKTGVLAWLNISEDGLCSGNSELSNLTKLNPYETGALIQRHSAIRGIKVRMSQSVVGNNGVRPLEIAKKVAREQNVPVMVHIGNAPPNLSEILNLLESGDVVTHAFHGKPGGILDARGCLIPEAVEALNRGVLFDVGHGSSSFSFQTMEKAKKLGLKPHSISTDIYKKNYNGPVHSLAITMSKMLYMGFAIDDVIEAVTYVPARVLRMDDQIGTLQPGTVADISIVRLVEKQIELVDSEGYMVNGSKEVVPIYTIKNGRVLDVRNERNY